MATPTPREPVERVEPDLEAKVPLSVPASLLGFLVAKARAFDAEVPPEGTEEGSDLPDDRAVGALESTPDNPANEELAGALQGLNEDQRRELVALVWLGRGDFTADEWQTALAQARDISNVRTVRYLLQTPLLGDLLEDGLDELGYNITEEEGRG